MAENETKGWYGSYSLAGKHSAEKFNNIVHKNEILRGEHKKARIHDLFQPDDPKLTNLEEHLDAFKMYSFDDNVFKKIDKKRKKIENRKKFKNQIANFKYFFHNKHCESIEERKKKLIPEPACTRYHPNYNYIWPKLITGPKWKNISGRKETKPEVDERDFLINNLENYDKYIINSGDTKCFVNMNKTTQRGNFIDFKDIRLKTEKPFIKLTKSKRKYDLANELNDGRFAKTFINGFRIYNVLNKKKNSKRNNKKLLINLKINPKLNNLTALNNSETKIFEKNEEKKKYEILTEEKDKNTNTEISFYKVTKRKNAKSIINSENAIMGSDDQPKNNIKNTAPNFSKLLSREQREKIKGYKANNIPYIVPNYSFVKERHVVMAIYKKKENSKKYKKKEFIGLDSSINFNPDSFIDKCNNHLSPKVPRFKNMISRPNKKGSPLPSFMQQIHDRSSINSFTDKSLQLNKYGDGKYIPASNSFFPKKSFNNIINVGFSNSKSFKENNNDEDIQSKKKQILNKLSLNHINYEELVKEGALRKFDNFSYKTILKEKKKTASIKPIISFEENEEDSN
jgi:hypothetical protein